MGIIRDKKLLCNNGRGQDLEPRWAALPGLEGGLRTGQVYLQLACSLRVTPPLTGRVNVQGVMGWRLKLRIVNGTAGCPEGLRGILQGG